MFEPADILRRALARAGHAGRAVLAPMVRVFENRYWRGACEEKYPPVFIIGAPRTGSTILYQALTNLYDLAYIDNTACRWHRNLRFGMWLSERLYGARAHDNFKAEHGNTSAFGGHAPSECGGFWYRWLPTDRHFVDHADVTEAMVAEIRAEVLGVSARLGKPMVFKNLNAGQRLRLIQRAFPDARLIFVRRDPRFVIRSILKARARVGAAAGQWWSIMPPNVEELKTLPEGSMCAAQAYFLEQQIIEDLALFPEQNVRIVHYQQLSKALIHELGLWTGAPARPGADCPSFQQDQPASLTGDERGELEKLAADYPFNKELFV
tara:strand:+ start:40363 stop:41328 length:966 start_codon:yes stop_codon:yes gene_type:complete